MSTSELQAKLRRWSCAAESTALESTPKESNADASAESAGHAAPNRELTFETQPTESQADAAANAAKNVPVPKAESAGEFDFARLLARAQTDSGSTEEEVDAEKVRATLVARVQKRFHELVKLGVAANDAAARAIVEVGERAKRDTVRVQPCRVQSRTEEDAHASSESENEAIESH